MNMLLKSAATAALLGAVVLASATPGEARAGRWVAAGAGLAAGTAVGAAAANAYGPGYYRRGYGSGYDAYASSGAVYGTPGSSYQYDMSGCGSQGNYGQSVDRSACNQ